MSRILTESCSYRSVATCRGDTNSWGARGCCQGFPGSFCFRFLSHGALYKLMASPVLFTMMSWLFDFGKHQVMFSACSWLFTPSLLLIMLKEPNQIPGDEYISAVYKESAFSTVLSLDPQVYAKGVALTKPSVWQDEPRPFWDSWMD